MVIAVTNSVEVEISGAHHERVLGSHIRDLRASFDKIILERERDLVVLR